MGYYTLATGQVDFGDLPKDLTKRVPRRWLPVAVLAWLGVSQDCQGHGIGRLLLAHALRDCYEAGDTFAFVAVILDCLTDAAKAFYRKWDFQELPGHPYRLFVSFQQLEAMMTGSRGAERCLAARYNDSRGLRFDGDPSRRRTCEDSIFP